MACRTTLLLACCVAVSAVFFSALPAQAESTLPDLFVRPPKPAAQAAAPAASPAAAPSAYQASGVPTYYAQRAAAQHYAATAQMPKPLFAAEPASGSGISSSSSAAQGSDPLQGGSGGGGSSSDSSSSGNYSPGSSSSGNSASSNHQPQNAPLPGSQGDASGKGYANAMPTLSTTAPISSGTAVAAPASTTTVSTTTATPPLPAPTQPYTTPVDRPSAQAAVAAPASTTTITTTTRTAPPVAMGGQATPESSYAPPPLSDSSLQNAVQNEAERAFYERKRKRTADTFEHAYEGLVPLGPNEVRDVMGRYERTQRSAVPPSTGQPRGQVRIKTLSLEPGSDPPTVNVAAGYVTSIAIVDATGQPWPIMDIGIGGNFEVSKTGGGAGSTHVVRIMPLTRFGFGNLSVLLQDLPTPIIFKLASGGATVDYRFDGRIPKLGPNAKLSLIERRSLQAGSALIMSFLDNAPPPDAHRVKINGADPRTMAWLMNDRMFVRTSLTMLSPSWDASVSSADGTTVYELKETPALLMSDNGNLIRARVAPKEDE